MQSSPSPSPSGPNYLRLEPLSFSSLPSHDDESLDQTADRPQLESFLTSVLGQAQTLVCSTIPHRFKADRKLRSSAPSTAKVQLFTSSLPSSSSSSSTTAGAGAGAGATISGDSGTEDYWVCRKSIHADSSTQRGSASWSEFESGLRENHSEHEMEYTPSVASVENLLRWPIVATLDGGWKEIDMHVNVITHTFKPGGLISPRTFISLVISAYEPETSGDHGDSNEIETPVKGFYTVQIPMRFQKDSTNNDVPDALKQKILTTVPKNTVFARYASVERVRLLPPAAPAAGAATDTNNTDGNRIEWIMATTSDAGGKIPQWVQRSWTMGGVPKAVVADVGLFLGWVDKKRAS